MQFQIAVARHLQDAQHLERLGVEVAARHRQQLALGQHEAALQQRLVGLRRDRRRAERLAQDARLQDARQAGDLARGQEIVPHETFDAVLAAVPRVAHARADHRLQVERQPLLGAAGDVVQMEPHGPEEFPGAAAMLRLGLASARRRHRRVRPWSACRRRSARSSRASAGRAARRGPPSRSARPRTGCRRSGGGAPRVRPAWRRCTRRRRPPCRRRGSGRGIRRTAARRRRCAAQSSSAVRIVVSLAPSTRQSSIERVAWPTFTPEVPQEVEHVLHHLQRLPRRLAARSGTAGRCR